jgi:hypothetical protein
VELSPICEEPANLGIRRGLAGPGVLKGQKQRVGVESLARGLQPIGLLGAEAFGRSQASK